MDWYAVGSWVDNFVHSSGFGGVAAVIAASVAYSAATRAADQQRDTAARDRWWDQAKWAFDRLDAPETQASALEAFDELLDRARDDSEKAFVQAALRPGLDEGVELSADSEADWHSGTAPINEEDQ